MRSRRSVCVSWAPKLNRSSSGLTRFSPSSSFIQFPILTSCRYVYVLTLNGLALFTCAVVESLFVVDLADDEQLHLLSPEEGIQCVNRHASRQNKQSSGA